MTVATGKTVDPQRWRPAIAALVAFVSVAWFFRFQIISGFTLFSGDRYDAMIEVSILGHWRNVLHGREAWNVTGWFHPAADTLGYNDGYLAYGLLYAPLRALGMPLVAAADGVHAVMKLVGFVGMGWLLGTVGRCRFGWRLFGATLFTIADVTLQHVNHGQLLTVGFAPWALLFGWRAVAALLAEDRRGLTIHGAAFIATLALWISTAFYPAWFFALYAAIALAVLVVRADGPARRRGFDAIGRCWPQLAMLAGLALALLAPFLIVYLPKRTETGMHPYGEALATALAPLDYINVTAGNIVWGGPFDLLRRTIAPGLAARPDAIFGIAPTLMVLAVTAIVRSTRTASGIGPGIVALAIATLAGWLLMLRLGNASLWGLVYLTVPGAAGIRVIGRFELVLLVPVILLATILIDRMRRTGPALALAALLLVEEANVAAPVLLDQADQRAMLADIPPLPADCASFYVVSARPYPYPVIDRLGDHLYAHNVDAMVLSAELGRPTVNGYSTFNPPHWDFDRADAADYPVRVRRYARRTGIAMPCRLDVRRGQFWVRDARYP